MNAARAKAVRKKQPPIELTSEEEEAMLRGLESIKAGKGIPLYRVRAILHRL